MIEKTEVDNIIDAIVDAHKRECKVLIAGNGGLDAESQHFAAELVGKFAFEVFVPCFALTGNSPLITAIGNDMGFENVFAHQVKVLGRKGDVFIGMTTSNSENIMRALKQAKEKELVTIMVCGGKSLDSSYADYIYRTKGNSDTASVQNDILNFLHYLATNVKRRLL